MVLLAGGWWLQGRSWLHHSGESKAAEKNFIPKQAIHTYHGHSKGVSAIRFFPGSGTLCCGALQCGRCSVVDWSWRRLVSLRVECVMH